MTHTQPEDEVMLLGCSTQQDAGKTDWSNQPHKHDLCCAHNYEKRAVDVTKRQTSRTLAWIKSSVCHGSDSFYHPS